MAHDWSRDPRVKKLRDGRRRAPSDTHLRQDGAGYLLAGGEYIRQMRGQESFAEQLNDLGN